MIVKGRHNCTTTHAVNEHVMLTSAFTAFTATIAGAVVILITAIAQAT